MHIWDIIPKLIFSHKMNGTDFKRVMPRRAPSTPEQCMDSLDVSVDSRNLTTSVNDKDDHSACESRCLVALYYARIGLASERISLQSIVPMDQLTELFLPIATQRWAPQALSQP